jgi:hypothetical protein
MDYLDILEIIDVTLDHQPHRFGNGYMCQANFKENYSEFALNGRKSVKGGC